MWNNGSPAREGKSVKVDKEMFEAVFRKLMAQPAAKRETLKTGEKKKAATIIPPKPQPGQ